MSWVAGVSNVKMEIVQTVKKTAIHWKVPRIISRHQHLNTGSCHHISEIRESYNDHGCSCCMCSEWRCIDCTEHHSVWKDTGIISRYQHLNTRNCHHISEIREFCNEQRTRVFVLQVFRMWRRTLHRLHKTPLYQKILESYHVTNVWIRDVAIIFYIEIRESYTEHWCLCCRWSECEEGFCIDLTNHHSVSKYTRIISRYQRLNTGSCHHNSEIREFCNEHNERYQLHSIL